MDKGMNDHIEAAKSASENGDRKAFEDAVIAALEVAADMPRRHYEHMRKYKMDWV